MGRPISLGILVCLLAPAAPATAQDAVVLELLACGRIEDAEKRLACFDALAGQYESGAAPTPGDQGARASQGRPADREPPGRAGEEVTTRVPAGPDGTRSTAGPGQPATTQSPAGREPETAPAREISRVEDLSVPHQTRIEAFAANRRGDYRFRIEEGFLFERAGGPKVQVENLTGATLTLDKNFLGQWRARVDGRARELWIRPVER